MSVISGQEVIKHLKDYDEGQSDLADLMERLRGSNLVIVDGELEVAYDPEIYISSANAAAVCRFLISQANEKGLNGQEWPVETEITSGDFERAIGFITDSVTANRVLLDEATPNEVKGALSQALIRGFDTHALMFRLLGVDRTEDPQRRRSESCYFQAHEVLSEFIKACLKV